MESKISIDISVHRQERILIKHTPSDDLRDTLVAFFIQTATPHGNPDQTVMDGYCRLSWCSTNVDGKGTYVVEVIPIHPIDMLKHIEQIKENAAKFSIAG